MPVINVHSAVTSGQLAPSLRALGKDDGLAAGRFDRRLAEELGAEDEASGRDTAGTDEARPGRTPVAAGAGRDQLGREASRVASTLESLPATGSVAPSDATEVLASDHAIVPRGSGDGAARATSAAPVTTVVAPDLLAAASMANVSHATPTATTTPVGGGPLFAPTAADGLTLTADAAPAATRSDTAQEVAKSDPRAQGEKTRDAGPDDTAPEPTKATDSAGAAAAALIPSVATTLAGKAAALAPAETSAAAEKHVRAPLLAKAPGGGSLLIDAAPPHERPERAEEAESRDRTPLTDPAPMPTSAGAHRPATSLSVNAGAVVADPAAVSAPLFPAAVVRSGATETDGTALRHVERLYAPHGGAASSASASALARLGTIGQDTGVALARGVADGRDHVALRLDPPDLGRIDVQLSFGPEGDLRAVVASDNRAALDLLRHDLDQLQRALADAGVRADAQSFHFSERQSGGGQRWEAAVARDQRYAALTEPTADRPTATATPRRLRSSGLVDVFA